MSDAGKPSLRVGVCADALLALCGLLLACSVHGAIPGAMVPVQLQMIWSGGFAESLANQGWLALWANDFGLPEPAPISFGLSGVLPMAALIRLGLAVQDAYAWVVLLWLTVAFGGAVSLARLLGAHTRISILLATCWLTQPVVWGHAGYSMLALGIALLPAYLRTTLSLLRVHGQEVVLPAERALAAIAVAMVAVFMDGYSFVMYGLASLCLIAFSWQRGDHTRQRQVLLAAIVQSVALVLAYVAYKRYVGSMPMDSGSLDTFRAYGLDLHYLVVPTRGLHPLFDALGWSAARSHLDQFGDFSVWTTTFALPMILLAAVALADRCGWARQVVVFGGLALLAMYLALGPSLKLLSTEHFNARYIATGNMPASAGWFETGSAWVSGTLPGFTSMRAAYRWTALSLCCLWMVVATWMGKRWRGRQTVPVLLVLMVIALQLPDLHAQWQSKRGMRKMFLALERDISRDMSVLGLKGTRVVVLPPRNDFLVNHMAARYRFKTFNIGGDKNLELARIHWPASVRNVRAGSSPHELAMATRNILLRSDADAVILPNVDMVEAAAQWPCEALSVMIRIAPWNRTGRATGDHGLLVSVPVDARFSEHVIYVRTASTTGADRLPKLSLRHAPEGTVLQQFSVGAGWTTVSEVRVTSSLEARLLMPTAPSCMGKTCEQDILLNRNDNVDGSGDVVFSNVGPECPVPGREAVRPVLDEMRGDPHFEVLETEHFSAIRLARTLREGAPVERSGALADFVRYPVRTQSSEPSHALLLSSGWYTSEPTHVWSTAEARLSLPRPAVCQRAFCEVLLDFVVFGADAHRPVSVTATHDRTGAAVTWVVRSPERFVGRFPMQDSAGTDDIRLTVSPAHSPRQLGLSQDDRVLGIGLQQVDVRSVTDR